MTDSRLILVLAILTLSGCTQSSDSKNGGDSAANKNSAVSIPEGNKTQPNLPKQFSIGKKAAKNVIAGWDIDVRPDGMGLPAGSGSVEDGEEIFEEKCSMCHGSFGEGVDQWPKLTGGEGTLKDARPEKTIGSYWPYASTLWDYINRAMPFPAPQSLHPDEVYALTAYILNMNEVVDDDFVLDRESFKTIKMPNENGFYVDDRPDTQNTRCMENCKDGAAIKVRLGPKYSLGASTVEKIQASTEQEKVNSTYETVCNVCHASGVAGAPKFGVSGDWTERLAKGKSTLYQSALNGLNGMPAKGGHSDLSDETVKQAVDYMLDSLK